ncbi:MAG: tetratricopeptide repeat protein [Planctomycetia bacterium]
MGFARYLTLVWPGMPWLWLRGSLLGLVLALAFAVILDVAVLTTWIWSELIDVRLSLAVWTATAAIWLAGTASAVTGFPPPIPRGRDAAAEKLFLQARDAYLCRDWLAAETKLRTVLAMAPTDGEAQLLLGTLLRRAGRTDEAVAAFESLARSDAGGPWRVEIARELRRIAAAVQSGSRDEPVVLPLRPDGSGDSATDAGVERAA